MTDSRVIPRREFLKAAVAIGGSTAVAACLEREQVDIPSGPPDLSSYPRRQHAWNEVLPADKQGLKGAVPPREMQMLPRSQVPTKKALPGPIRGPATSGDTEFVVTILRDATCFGGDEEDTSVTVSPRTPYNRYMLLLMSLSGILKQDDDLVCDDLLQPTIDPDLQYHYGASIADVQSGGELIVTVDAPPQTTHHEGYETAFFELSEMTITL